MRISLIGFNSILVQLEVAGSVPDVVIYQCFNSILVQLEAFLSIR